MLKDIIEVKALDNYSLFIRFEDGVSGEVKLTDIVPFEGVFAPLRDSEYFKQVYVNKDIGTICWENGADISPETLYKKITE